MTRSFCSQANCTDGASPYAALIQATDRNLYGTASLGGVKAARAGTVFKITPSGELTRLRSFDGTNWANPSTTLIQATGGNLYGTTENGGGAINCPNGLYSSCGTVFKNTPSGELTTLHSFDGSDGFGPP